MTESARPVWVGEMELGTPSSIRSVGPQTRLGYEHAKILVRLHAVPVGFIELSLPPEGIAEIADARRVAYRELGDPIRSHLTRDGTSVQGDISSLDLGGRDGCSDVVATGTHEPLTVVVCSRDRPAQLAACLAALRQLRYDAFEVVVVDNAPSDDAAATSYQQVVGSDDRFRYVVEPRPGLSRARNRGLAEAAHPYVAFTDDDVLVDPLWLDGIVRGFARDRRAGCVTGLVPSAQLDSSYQRYFDQRVWWSSRVESHVYDLAKPGRETRLFPYDAGRIGTGANFAIDRELIVRLGGFDEALGAGSPTRGGEDLDAFVRVLRAGRTIVYEPSAIAWHVHRLTYEELHRHLYGFGMGLSAYVTKYLVNPATRVQVVRRVLSGVGHMLSLWGRADTGERRHPSLVLAEARGIAAGPFAYRRARRAGRRSPR